MLLRCSKCKEDRPAGDFSKGGGPGRRQWQTYCRACMVDYRLTIPKELTKARSKISRDKYKDAPDRRLKSLLDATTVDRSALDYEWAWNKLQTQDFKCEVTGVPFEWTSRSPYGLSIDRIDTDVGYTKENVRFVCWWLNAAMGNWGLAKLKELIKDLPIGT